MTEIIPITYDNLEKASKDKFFITPNETGLFIVHEAKNIVDVDYRDFAEKMYFEMAFPRAILIFQNHSLTKNFPEDFVDAFTRKKIHDEYNEWDNQQVLQPFLVQLLIEDLNKKAQLNLLKGRAITPQQIHAFFRESAKLGYLYSQYFFTEAPKGYTQSQIPSFAYIHEDGQVEKYDTTLSDKAIEHIVQTQKRTFVRFATKGEKWHCIISDLSSITGRERGKEFGGIPHMHYISNAFGINKEVLMESLQEFDHPSSASHIRLQRE